VIDLALLRDNPDLVKRSQEARGESPDTVDAAIEADRARRAITAFEELRAAQNAHGKTVASAPKEDKPALVAQAKELSDRVKAAQQAVTAAEEAADAALARIENIVIDGVPAGGEENFVTVRTHGEPASFDFEPSTTSPSARSSARSTWSAAPRSPAAASTSSPASARASSTLMSSRSSARWMPGSSP
jgi:seryl-tRNA synthetase